MPWSFPATCRPILLGSAALLPLAGGFPATADAAGSVSGHLQIAARVVDDCSVRTATLTFAPYTPGAGIATGQGTLAILCTAHTTARVALSQGAHPAAGSSDAAPARRMADGSALLDYGLYRDAGFTLPWGNSDRSTLVLTGTGKADSIPVFGLIGAGQDVPPGLYTDVVMVTLTF